MTKKKKWNSEEDRLNWLNQLKKAGRDQEEVYQERRLKSGQDPDEHTIYNVICPQIRKTWTMTEELRRRACGRRIRVETNEIVVPRLVGNGHAGRMI